MEEHFEELEKVILCSGWGEGGLGNNAYIFYIKLKEIGDVRGFDPKEYGLPDKSDDVVYRFV